MTVLTTPIAGVHVVTSQQRPDDRGTFMRLYCEQELAALTCGRRVVQINHSVTREAGTVRGLHFQWPPHAEMKFVRCLRGRAWDVAVDLRTGSPTFMQWFAYELSPEGADMMVIPEGCAHGFQALVADTELLYLHTSAYHWRAESALRWDEARVGVRWPLPVTALSPRDASHPHLAKDFQGIRT